MAKLTKKDHALYDELRKAWNRIPIVLSFLNKSELMGYRIVKPTKREMAKFWSDPKKVEACNLL